MPSGESADSLNFEEVYTVFGNPVKRKIIELLAERGAMPFSELKRELGTSVGALYYNLDGLKGFVDKDESRRYILTSKGHALYKAMREGDEAIKRALATRKPYAVLLDKYILSILAPQQLFVPFYRNAYLSALALILSLSVGVSTTLVTRLPLKLIEVEQVPLLFPRSILALTLQPEVLLVLEYAVSFLVSTAFIALVSHLISGSRCSPLCLATGLAVAQLPLYAYMLVQFALTGQNYPNVSYTMMLVLALLLRLLQALTLGLLTAAVSVFCRTSRERGFLAASLLLYLSFFLKSFLP